MVLALVVGPSGAGKDTLIGRAHEALASDPRFVFVRRVVTRHAVAALEDHDTMDEAAFTVALMRGDFALHWDAHGLRYGIPRGIVERLDEGTDVIANLSRAALPEARYVFRGIVVLALTARPEVLAERLRGRGRETGEDIAARLARANEFAVEGPDVIRLDNSGTPEETVAAARAMLYPERV
jgi:ribose 1,5-bisphosphokinase